MCRESPWRRSRTRSPRRVRHRTRGRAARRRRALTDAAVALLAEQGAHGLTHRAVETLADVLAGTATNYFRNREALLVAAAERVLELHLADMIAESLWTAATTLRDRYLAIFELQLEARRRPALSAVLAGLGDTAIVSTTGLHGELGTPVPEESIPTLITLYGGTLFTLVTLPVDLLDKGRVRTLTEAMVRGALATGRAGESA